MYSCVCVDSGVYSFDGGMFSCVCVDGGVHSCVYVDDGVYICVCVDGGVYSYVCVVLMVVCTAMFVSMVMCLFKLTLAGLLHHGHQHLIACTSVCSWTRWSDSHRMSRKPGGSLWPSPIGWLARTLRPRWGMVSRVTVGKHISHCKT